MVQVESRELDAQSLRVSILVVSRTATLVNRLLRSLEAGYGGDADSVEVLISWNGSAAEEGRIEPCRLPWRVVQRDPYHFAGNMNRLARQTLGAVLVFANDDLIADPTSVDAAIERLETRPEVGIVGARLLTSSGQLAHAGIHFTSYGSPYHQLEHVVDANHPVNEREQLVPAVTGAFFAMRRADFLQLEFAETFQACGEDVLLCLQTRSQLHKQVLFCPAMGGVHDAETTRSQFETQQGNENDMQRLRSGWRDWLQRADHKSLQVELRSAQDEAEDLRGAFEELQRTLGSRVNKQNQDIGNLTSALAEQRQQTLQLRAQDTKTTMQQSLLESENKRLRSRIQQLENECERIRP